MIPTANKPLDEQVQSFLIITLNNPNLNNIKLYLPYGLNDLFSMIVRPNKLQITRDVYERKVEKWTKVWPNLQVIPWQQI